ncbi:MAG: class A beta-lactamase-related serine hydrolase, partial [Bacteroidetes bacterium]|nr:class A beta-lactamase-related serine hydrolase [Bacteroidota bacterium]
MKTITSLMLMITFIGTASAQSLQDSVNALVEKYKGEVGIYAVDLANGDTVSYNSDKRFETASVIKIWVLGKLYQEAKHGTLSLSDRVVLTDSDKVPGSGILQFMNAGLNPTLHDLAWLMIDLSDNSAANMLVDQVGGLKKVDGFIRSVGLRKTKMISKIFMPHTSIDTVLGKRFGIGVTTPRETAIYLTKLYKGEIVDSASSMAMIKLMEDQTYNIDIPRFLPTYKDTI